MRSSGSANAPSAKSNARDGKTRRRQRRRRRPKQLRRQRRSASACAARPRPSARPSWRRSRRRRPIRLQPRLLLRQPRASPRRRKSNASSPVPLIQVRVMAVTVWMSDPLRRPLLQLQMLLPTRHRAALRAFPTHARVRLQVRAPAPVLVPAPALAQALALVPVPLVVLLPRPRNSHRRRRVSCPCRRNQPPYRRKASPRVQNEGRPAALRLPRHLPLLLHLQVRVLANPRQGMRSKHLRHLRRRPHALVLV